MAETKYNVLVVYNDEHVKCEYFHTLDVSTSANVAGIGSQLRNGHYLATQTGLRDTTGQLTMCQIELLGGYYYVFVDPNSRSYLVQMTLGEYENWSVAQHTVANIVEQAEIYEAMQEGLNTQMNNANEGITAAATAFNMAAAARHAAEADAQRIEGKINTLTVETNQRLNSLTNNTDVALATLQAETAGRTNGMETEVRKSVKALQDDVLPKVEAMRKRLEQMRSPVTGRCVQVEDVAEDLFRLHRQNTLTAQEYEQLSLEAAKYDAYVLTAYLYVTAAKTLLV